MSIQSMSTKRLREYYTEAQEWLQELKAVIPSTHRQVGAKEVRINAVSGLITRCQAELSDRKTRSCYANEN